MARRSAAAGLLFAAALVTVAVAAAVTGNNLLFLVLAAMLATLMISNLISRLSLAGLELDFRLPEHVSARRKFPARIVVHNKKGWMPSFSVRLVGIGDSIFPAVYFPVLPGGATLDQILDVEFERRGIHREDGFQFSTAFPFGFLERKAQVALRSEILVYPCMNPQPGFEEMLAALGGEVAAHYRGRGHDFHRIRPYEFYESARHVDWKATAHTGELQVREFAREEEPLVEIFLDIDVPLESAEWFEYGIEFCAFLVWHFTQQEARVRFVSQDMATTVPATGDVYRILKYLALVAPRAAGAGPAPVEVGSYHIVFTAEPQRYAETGWSGARFVTPETARATGTVV